jgi:hypothetical protein
MGHQSRLFLILDPGGGLTQMMHGNLAIIAAIGAAGIARRASLPIVGAWLAAVLVLANRAVVWQSASAETDTVLAGVVAMTILAYLAWRESRRASLLVLFGIFAGIGVLAKYHGLMVGLVTGAVMIWDMIRGRKLSTGHLALVAVVALLTIAPHFVRNIILTGNPIFPLFNDVFNPDQRNFFSVLRSVMGTGRSLWDLIIAPWMISIDPNPYFDGMMFGAPLLLALAPLAVLYHRPLRHLDALRIFLGGYYLVWFYAMMHQTRFLLPILPLLTVFAAAGATAIFSKGVLRTLRIAAAVPVVLLFVLQGSFAGIYAFLRMPPALGAISAERYLDHTPMMDGAHYGICKYVERNLKPDERYLLFLTVKFYCPQAAADNGDFNDDLRYWVRARPPAPPLRGSILTRLIDRDYRFVVVGKTLQGSCDSRAARCPTYRIGNKFIAADMLAVLQSLKPVKESHVGAVFDGREVTLALRRLREQSGKTGQKQ